MVESKKLDRTLGLSNHIQKKDIQKANKMIKDLEDKMNEEYTPEQIKTIENELAKPDKGLFNRISAYALTGITALTIGLTSPPPANAADMGTITRDGKNEVMTTYGDTGLTAKGEISSLPQGGQTGTINGQTIIRYNDQTGDYDDDDTPSYASEIDRLNAEIKQNPNNADNYIALSNEYIKKYDKDGIDLVIKTYLKALPRAKYMSNEDNARIRYDLAIRYHNKNQNTKSREMFKEVLKYDKENKDVKMWLDFINKK